MTAELRAACLAALCAGFLYGCQSAPEEKAPQASAPAAAPAPAPVAAAPEAPVAAPAAVEPPKPAAKPRPPAKKPAPKPQPKPPEPEVAKPAPPPPPPQPSPEEERKRRLDAYVAAIGRSTVGFTPPSPIPVAQRAAIVLTITPPAETAALAADLRKSLDPAAGAWTPRMRARLAGTDFDVAPAEGREFDGTRDLAPSGPTEWRWTVVPTVPGSKKLVATLSFGLPPPGGARDLPPLQRDVLVEASLSWQAGRLWNDYWLWLVVAVVAVCAIALWAKRR